MQMVGIVLVQHAFKHLGVFPNFVYAKFRKHMSFSQSIWVHFVCRCEILQGHIM